MTNEPATPATTTPAPTPAAPTPTVVPEPRAAGQTSIAPMVILKAAVAAALQVEGVQLGEGNVQIGLSSSRNPNLVTSKERNAAVEMQGEDAVVSLRLMTELGKQVYPLCDEVRTRVAEAVQFMTGKRTKAVNIEVVDTYGAGAPPPAGEPAAT
jgi:uncharacterized alkaline shock family protein YloU